MYNTFGLYFHAADQTWGPLFQTCCLQRMQGQHWGHSVDVSFQIPERRGAAVISTGILSGESPFLLFMHCCFMSHMLLQDSTVVSFLPVPPPPLFWCPWFSMIYCHHREGNTDLSYSALPSLSPHFIYVSNEMIWLKARVIYNICLKAVWQGLGKYRSGEVPHTDL